MTVRYNRDGQFEFTGISRDLSNGGIFLYTESVIEVGAQVELTLILPSESAEPNLQLLFRSFDNRFCLNMDRPKLGDGCRELLLGLSFYLG